MNYVRRLSVFSLSAAVVLIGLAAATWPVSAATYEETVEHEMLLSEGGQVRVETSNGYVNVVCRDEERVLIRATKWARGCTAGGAKKLVADIEVTVDSDDDVVVEVDIPTEIFHLCPIVRRKVNIDAEVPCKVDLDMSTSNSEVQVEGVEGTVQIETSNGRISAKSIRGDLEAHTSNGRISLSDVEGSINVRTSNGRIRLEDCSGEITARTSNGQIRVELTDLTDDLELKTSNGSITVIVPEDISADIDATTSNGEVTSELPLTVTTFSKRHVEGKINKGGPLMKLRTSNGSINIRTR